MPPRHSKSDSASKKFPAWCMGRNPEWEVIVGCYGIDLALDFSRAARDYIEQYGPRVFDVGLAPGSSGVNEWRLAGREAKGGFKAAGVGTGVSGKGAHLFVVDDPFKDHKQAESESYRENVWKWYQSVARTRIAPGGRIIIIQTRWHEDDLTGRLIEEDKRRVAADKKPRWRQCVMPFIDDSDGRPLGELTDEELLDRQLWTNRYSAEEIREIIEGLGSYFFNALFQQRPSNPEGQIFKRRDWKFWTSDPSKANGDDVVLLRFSRESLGDLHWMAQSWDCAFKETADSDFVVGQAWGGRGPDRFLLDQIRGRMDVGDTINAIRQMTMRWPNARAKFIEDKANGPAVISKLQKEISGIVEVQPEGGKVVRARACQPDVQSGHVYLPYDAPFVHEADGFIDECASFPTGKNDDQVDAMTQLLNRMTGKGAAALRARGMVNS